MAKAETIPGFTEGPWVLSPNGTHIRKTLHGYNICSLDESAPDVIREANARLIAASPDLYAALKAVRHIIEADAERMLATIGSGGDAEGKHDGAISYIEQVDAALSRVEQPQ